VPEEMKKATVAPLLAVRRGIAAIEFYKTAFGAVEKFRTESPDGAVVAQLSIGDCEFWLADEAPEHQNFSPESLGGSTVRMVLVVDDPDGVFNHAVASGTTAGASAALSIRLGTIGRSANLSSTIPEHGVGDR